MRLEHAELLVECLLTAGHEPEDVRVRVNYAGRGMFGKTTNAVVCPSWAAFCEAVALATASLIGSGAHPSSGVTFGFAKECAKLSADSYGRGSIVIY